MVLCTSTQRNLPATKQYIGNFRHIAPQSTRNGYCSKNAHRVFCEIAHKTESRADSLYYYTAESAPFSAATTLSA